MKFSIALQPYTIREELSKDYFGALARVAEIGYQGIELGPPPEGITVAKLKDFLNRHELQVIGCHASLEQLTGDLDSLAAYLREVGGAYVAVSRRFDSRQAVIESARLFNQIGERCYQRGIQFLYHNHDWEFVQFEGIYAYDLLLQETDPDLVQIVDSQPRSDAVRGSVQCAHSNGSSLR